MESVVRSAEEYGIDLQMAESYQCFLRRALQ